MISHSDSLSTTHSSLSSQPSSCLSSTTHHHVCPQIPILMFILLHPFSWLSYKPILMSVLPTHPHVCPPPHILMSVLPTHPHVCPFPHILMSVLPNTSSSQSFPTNPHDCSPPFILLYVLLHPFSCLSTTACPLPPPVLPHQSSIPHTCLQLQLVMSCHRTREVRV